MALFKVSGSFDNSFRFLKAMREQKMFAQLNSLGQEGVAALMASTPRDSGSTAASWSYEIIDDGGQIRIVWSNSNVNNGFNVAVGLQYGHGTGTGGYVVGRDYINPAMRPTFDKIVEQMWRVVTNA